LAEQLGVEVLAPVATTLELLDLHRMLPRPRVAANSRDLPADLLAGRTARDPEAVSLDLARHVQARCLGTDGRQLVAIVGVEVPEIARQPDDGGTPAVQGDRAAIQVEHLGCLDCGMGEGLVGGVLWMVDAEGFDAARGEVPDNLDAAHEVAGESGTFAEHADIRAVAVHADVRTAAVDPVEGT
jgi:hypothetical protein